MTVEIMKNHPMPEAKVGAPEKWPFSKLKVGDAFSFPAGTKAAGCRSAVRNARLKHLDRVFQSRTDDNGIVTVWRTK